MQMSKQVDHFRNENEKEEHLGEKLTFLARKTQRLKLSDKNILFVAQPFGLSAPPYICSAPPSNLMMVKHATEVVLRQRFKGR